MCEKKEIEWEKNKYKNEKKNTRNDEWKKNRWINKNEKK